MVVSSYWLVLVSRSRTRSTGVAVGVVAAVLIETIGAIIVVWKQQDDQR